MSRHRRRQLHRGWGRVEEYEVRDIANAVIAALAYRRDNGMIVVDVDDTLHGQDREDAIQAALEPFREGQLVAGPLALIAAAGEAVLKVSGQYHKAAAALAGTGAVAALGLATLVVTGGPEPGGHPAVVESILQTVIAEPAPFATLFWTPAPMVSAPTPSIRPSESAPPEAGIDPVVRRPGGPRDASDGSDRAPSTTPSSKPRRTVEHQESEPGSEPARTRQPAAEPTREEVAAGQEEPPPKQESPKQESRTPVDDLVPDVTVSVDPPLQPKPQPDPSGEGCGGIGVDVDLGQLGGVDVCIG